MKRIIKRNKTLAILLLITILSFLLGILFHATLDQDNKKIVIENIEKIIEKSPETLIQNIINNNTYIIINWLLGISIIGIPIVIIMYSIKVFVFSFELISFIKALKLKKILYIIIYFLPKSISIFLFFLLTYYSINYSIYLIKFLFLHKKVNFQIINKKYIKILIQISIANSMISLMNYYVIYKILKIKI